MDLPAIRLGSLLLALAVGISDAAEDHQQVLGVRAERDYSVILADTLPVDPSANAVRVPLMVEMLSSRALLAGDSWARYMWTDGSHNDIFDKFGHGEKRAFSLPLLNDPGPGYSGPEYSVGGSEARHWADTANYPWIANMVAALEANPDITTVILSIGGNDMLDGKPNGGWYKDMDLDVPGAEAALLEQVKNDTRAIINAALNVRPNIQVMLSSYDYPNFNVGLLCFVTACPMRRDLSRDPDNDLVTDAELNAMLAIFEATRVELANEDERVYYDHSLGLLQYYFGDGIAQPFVLPYPGQEPPLYEPFPGGNPQLPTLRSLFRRPGGLDIDPIHLSFEGYQYKITNQTQSWFLPRFRGDVSETFFSHGGDQDGWTDGILVDTNGIVVGDNGSVPYYGIVSFDTSSIPDGATVTNAALYLHRASLTGTNPFTSGALGAARVDVARGSFGGTPVEATDAIEVATSSESGDVIGSAIANGYAIRIEITGTGLTAVNDNGLTQLRIYFPSASSGGDADFILFHDGDATLPSNSGLPTLADFMGTAAPFLDVAYDAPTDVSMDDVAQSAPLLHRNSPNPFVQSTTLQFTLAKPGLVKLSIFDVAGHRVATLLERNLDAGQHIASWNGRDHTGKRVASGVYLTRLSLGHLMSTGRIVLLDP